ncbi:MAG: family 20 glycosylhydrolase, partial [Armatimonadota bacterium]
MRWLTPLLLAFVTITSAIEPNLLTNSNFEVDADNDGLADGWIAEIHRHEGGEGSFSIDKNVKVHGRFSQRIVHTSEKGWVRASQIGIPARPNSLYLFRCFVKANCRFLLIVYAFKADDSYDTFVVAQGAGTGGEWKLFSGIVRTPTDARSFKVSLITDSKGEAWFDSAELILLERPPYIFVPVTTRSPQLDGDLSDDVWQETEPLTPFLELGTGKIAEPATMAKVVATETHLFVAFYCSEPEPQKMRLRTPESGEPAYMDDCVEVYLDPQHSHDGFWQLVVTPKGNKWAQQVEQSRWAKVWWLLPRATQRLIADGWQAATKIGSNFWSAEIAIPFSLLGIKPQTGKIIGVNLCRSRKVERSDQNSAFAYFEEQTFQRPEKFPHLVFEGRVDKQISKLVDKPAGKFAGEKIVSSADGQIGKLAIGQARGLATRQLKEWSEVLTKIVPKPQRTLVHDGEVVLTNNITVVLPDGAAELERTAAELLIDTVKRSGLQAKLTNQLARGRESIVILTTFDRLPVDVHPHLPVDKLRSFFGQRGEEAYAIFIGTGDEGRGTKRQKAGIARGETRQERFARIQLPAPNTLFIVGASPRGVFNGVQTLRQLIWAREFGRSLTLPICEIWDYPDLKLRGWHFVAPLRHELSFAEKLLEWFALMKFNTLVIEVDDRFPYERHPEIAHPQALTKSQWQEFLAKARKLGFDVIPQVQTFGHFGYVLGKEKYRHLREQTEPHPRWGFFAYCPSNPETYMVVFDLFDEVLEVFKPRWFHIGHDEITFVPIGVCDRCKATGKTAWQLLAEDIRKLYDYLKAKGVERVAMWCDQLEPDRTGGYAPYFTHFAADLIPKDIMQFCWHYDARQTFPWLTRLKDKGFDVVACGWYHAQNVWRFAAESFDRRALGYCGTTWYGVTGFATQVDLMTAVVLGAQNSWSVDNPPIDTAPHPTNIAQDLWAMVGERSQWRNGLTEFSFADLSPFVNASLTRWG